jgi:pre-mRNA cleavage complex 2 protein Pcf11
MEWIQSRELPEDAAPDDNANNVPSDPTKPLSSTAGASAKNRDPKSQFILAPTDHTLASLPCPICQEKFSPTYNLELQDWVWQDAIRVGGRVYHASCYADLKKDGGATPEPESVLGKRKADGPEQLGPERVKRESLER